MSKFSYLLILTSAIATFALTSCVHSADRRANSSSVISNSVRETATADDDNQVLIDRESNSFKVQNKSSVQSNSEQRLRPMFDWPVWEARMTRGYLPRGTKKRRRPHRGIDLAATRGSAVLAAHDAVVIYTGSGFRGYGKMVMLESVDPRDGGNWATLYAHLDKILVYEGKRIKQGEVIGALGNTGRSSGPHLHFEIRRLNGPIDPLPLLPAGHALTNNVDNGSAAE